VFLKREQVGGESTCRVLMIDTSAPHRRPLRKDACRPMPRGAIDLAQYLWQSPSYVRERLAAEGFTLKESVEVRDIKLLVTQMPWLETMAGRTLILLIVTDPFNCKRVVGIVAEGNPNP
jgi:hypothetical protein